MVNALLQRLNGLSFFVQAGIVTLIAAAALVYLTPVNGAFIDLWLTHDQQGRRLFEAVEYESAAQRFDDLWWKGTSQYRAGDYSEAAGTWARIPAAEGFYNRGNAHMRAFEYRQAIDAYELAVAEAPDWLDAEKNLELARYTLSYIERAREQGDTGEQRGIGADDVVYDNTGERGAETEVTRESAVEAQSAEKWMRSVDTKTADFLRSRFLLEASREGRL